MLQCFNHMNITKKILPVKRHQQANLDTTQMQYKTKHRNEHNVNTTQPAQRYQHVKLDTKTNTTQTKHKPSRILENPGLFENLESLHGFGKYNSPATPNKTKQKQNHERKRNTKTEHKSQNRTQNTEPSTPTKQHNTTQQKNINRNTNHKTQIIKQVTNHKTLCPNPTVLQCSNATNTNHKALTFKQHQQSNLHTRQIEHRVRHKHKHNVNIGSSSSYVSTSFTYI